MLSDRIPEISLIFYGLDVEEDKWTHFTNMYNHLKITAKQTHWQFLLCVVWYLHCLFASLRKVKSSKLWVLSFLFLVKGAELTIHLRAASSAPFPLFQLPREPLLSTSFNLVYFPPTHNVHLRHTHDFPFLFFSFDQILFSNSVCVRKALWRVPEPKHQGSPES